MHNMSVAIERAGSNALWPQVLQAMSRGVLSKVIVESRRISAFKIDCLQAFDLAVFLKLYVYEWCIVLVPLGLQMYSYESNDSVPMVSSLWGLFLFLNIIS